MLRSFDVPLMVILSSILGEQSYHKFENTGISSAKEYLILRIKRLVIPTWIFLLIYFGISFVVEGHFKEAKYYIASFCMTRYGIGYVWVILIYLYCAFLIPLYNKLGLCVKGIVGVAVIYSLYELAYYFKVGVDNKFIDSTVYYIIPYGVLTYLGYNYSQIKKNIKIMIIIVSMTVFLFVGGVYWYMIGSPQLVQIAKYPPRLYYLGYGIACSFALLLVCGKLQLKIYNHPVIQFISIHSMWIYLWHILALVVYDVLGLPDIWYVKLIIVYLIAIIIVYFVNKLLDVVEYNRKYEFLKYLRG